MSLVFTLGIFQHSYKTRYHWSGNFRYMWIMFTCQFWRTTLTTLSTPTALESPYITSLICILVLIWARKLTGYAASRLGLFTGPHTTEHLSAPTQLPHAEHNLQAILEHIAAIAIITTTLTITDYNLQQMRREDFCPSSHSFGDS